MITGKKVKQKCAEEFVPAKTHVTLTTADALKILREKNALSQLELAELTGLSQATISSLERGRINLGVERAKVLARVLKVHPAILVFPDWESEITAA